ncbi:hypothetical protein L7F22_020498 [Adiantum nelumboides]|nr:hypothetical protein [Adiantum nelumboides]
MNGCAWYQKRVNKVFSPFLGTFVKDLIDDFCVYNTRKNHCSKLEVAFKQYDESGGQLNPKKCYHAQPRVKFLEHMVLENGIEADPDKVKALILLPSPKDTKQLATFLQKVKYMSRFISLSSQLLYPLQQVAKLDPLQWSNECEEVFQCIREVLGSLPTMQAPNWHKEFYVNPSVGEDAIGAMLLQQGTNSHYMKPIYYASRVKLEVKRDYTDVELIMVSVVYACRRFRHLPLTLCKRLMKFIVELQEFQFSFLVEESTRSTLTDFLTYKEAPLLVKKDTLKKQHMEAPDIDNAFLLFFDGSYRKSHNEASGGVVIYDPQGNLVTKRGLKLTAQSNNDAEYATLEKGLQLCLELRIQRVKVKGDALLVVKPVLGVWQSKNPRLKNMCFHVKNLLKHFEAWSLRHIDRSHNEEAHAAAQAMIGQLYVIRADSPLYLGRESLKKEEGFLQTGLLPTELEKSKKYAFLRRAKRYMFVGDSLYMKGADLVMRRVPWKEEIYKVLEENHEAKGKCYILTAVDYLSRWAEAKPVKQITSKDVAKFVYEDICYMPLELLSDKGPGFRGELVDYLCEKLHVRHRFTTPYYPQCNGMNERFNGELIRMLTKLTQSKVKTWDLELPCALWAYRTAIKTGTGFSPFHLVFGKEALLSIEVEISALKMMLKFEEANHDALRDRLLYLQCLQLDRALALEHYEQVLKTSQAKANAKVNAKVKDNEQVLKTSQAKANAKVKDKGIKKGDSTFQKKFQIKWLGPFLVLDRFPNGTYQLADLNGTPHKARVNGYRLKKYYARLMVVIEDKPSFEESADMVADREEIMKTSSFALQDLFAATVD